MEDFLSQFRDTDFRLEKLSETLNRLPVGVRTTEGKILRKINFRDLDRSELKKIWDRKFAQNHPLQAITRILALVIEDIEGEPVYADYVNAGFREYPKILQEMALADTSYALVCGHIHNFGYKIEKVRTQCLDEMCEKKQVIDIVNLEELMVEVSDDDLHTVAFELPVGFAVADPDNAKKGLVYPLVEARLPVIGDALKYERYYRPNDQGDFYERIYGDCLFELRTKDGVSLAEERLNALGTSLIKKMSARDSAEFEGHFNQIPTLLMMIQAVCQYCSEDLPVLIQQSFLFPKRR